ncbi:alpha/beta fold hydrolase [Robiginitalea sp. SC105]|uniref:alpha/beta fold hydrolase n=1 Tax=Robiginitalea sp. SC105 TaxID=2762332 RepID=UPI0016398A9B|nr:alpha/beta hydrolase [Robiginitalea sp. SC105]MBC2840137.1 alpha/beta hydrolase [Robiginitalea sp. SC105]
MKSIHLKILILTVVTTSGFLQEFSRDASQTLQVNDLPIHFEVYGEGAPLLLLHGWTQSSRFWRPYIPALEEHFRVYVLDLPGHGRSGGLGDDFSIQKTARDLDAFLKLLELGPVRAIGLSYGGLALLELAHLRDTAVEAMVLIGVSQAYNGSENADVQAAFTYEDLPAAFVEELKRNHPRGEGQIRALFNPHLDYQIDLSDEEVAQIQARCLIVQGDRDEVVGVEPAFRLHRHLPHSQLWIVPDTGHLAIGSDPTAAFLTTSIRFLRDGE